MTLLVKSSWQGCDIAEGDVVLKSGERLGPAEIGLLATVGVLTVKVVFFNNFLSVYICDFFASLYPCLILELPLIYAEAIYYCLIMAINRYILPQQLLCFRRVMNLLSQPVRF